jgi:acrylyl-CoA reductase (NADPH)
LSPTRGPAIVTGASGGVGSIAIAILAKNGWHVTASTGRLHEADYLSSLGATEVIDRRELMAPTRHLAAERWIAGIDSVGSHTLANVLSMTRYGGAIAACGMVGGLDLPASVAPLILRGVSLLGIDSVACPRSTRLMAWARLASDLDRARLGSITTTVPFKDVVESSRELLAGRVRGRIVVNIG